MKTFKLIHHMWILFLIVLVSLAICVTTIFILMSERIQHDFTSTIDDTHRVLVEHVQDRLHLLLHANASSYNVARLLSSTISMNASSLPIIETKVSPQLFMELITTLQPVSQISYIAKNGHLLSYYREWNQTYGTFSNISSHSANDFSTHGWYSQEINETSGENFGDVITMPQMQPSESQWLHDALNGKSGCASWGVSWGTEKLLTLFFTAPVANGGVISIGIAIKDFANYVFGIDLHGAQLYLSTRDGHFLEHTKPLDTIYDLTNNLAPNHTFGNNSILFTAEYINGLCNKSNNGLSSIINMDILGKKYAFDCVFLDVGGIQMVTAIVFPYKGGLHLFRSMKVIIILLLSILVLALIFGSYEISQLFRRSQEQEVFLRAQLIKLKDAVQQAERKSMNKSLAFASASHDVRTSLAGITGLIDICRGEVQSESELNLYLNQMNACAHKLLGIVNSILDTSKVEAGKMQLEEVEFDMAQVLEESVDLCHIAALDKGLEIIWDPCDFSILRLFNVKGDSRRLKQILDNLLSNARKFTPSGHIVLHAWAKRPSFQHLEQSSEHNCRFSFCSPSRWFHKDGHVRSGSTALSNVPQDPNLIEFVFEIDDTGIGVPKEKRASIFENYVQVRESSSGDLEGTGLGLGIVQSFVRLMGGEICIQDKDHGERGTCFRFNIFLRSVEPTFGRLEGEAVDSCISQMSKRTFSRSNHVATQSSSRAMEFRETLKVGGIRTVLLVKGDETRRILQRWMENIGMEVSLVDHWEHLYPLVKKIKCTASGSGKSDATSNESSLNRIKSSNSNADKEASHDFKDEDGQVLPVSTKDVSKKRVKDSSACMLIIVNTSCLGDGLNMFSILNNFSKGYPRMQFKFVWLADMKTRGDELRRLKERSCDLVLKKPIHGSRLHSILTLIRGFGGRNDDAQQTWERTSPTKSEKVFALDPPVDYVRKADSEKPFTGMKFLVVEDHSIQRLIAGRKISSLGGVVEFARNGLEALSLIKSALQEASHKYEQSNRVQGILKYFPHDVVLMDCEMPEMNGYEATKNVREEEKIYGIHIPIVALTAHETPEEQQKIILSGMDLHLKKSMDNEQLVDAIRCVRQN